MAGGIVVVVGSGVVNTDVLGAKTSAVSPPDVCSARTVVEEPEPSVMDGPPGERVEPEMVYWDLAFGVRVSVPMVRRGGAVVEEGSGEVRGP